MTARNFEAALALHRFGFGPVAGSIPAIADDPRGALLADLERPGAGRVAAAQLPNSAQAARSLFEFRAERLAKEKLAQRAKQAAEAEGMHGFELPMTPADRTLLAHQLTLAHQVAMKFPTLADAERAHMVAEGPFSPGLGLHVAPPGAGLGSGAGNSVMTDAQIEHPISWIYDGTKPDSPIAGLFYGALVPNPAGFAGPNDVWHHHSNICIVMGPGGHIDTPLGADHDVTTAQCTAVHGFLIKATFPLLHVWVVPGYEDSQGVFAHLNPAITCNDGTYHTVPQNTIGYRVTTCVDGTE